MFTSHPKLLGAGRRGPAMEVTVELYGTLRDAVGRKRLSVSLEDGATVDDALAAVTAEHEDVGPLVYDGEGRVRPNVSVSVGEVPVREREGAATPVEDGDTLIVAPGVAGG